MRIVVQAFLYAPALSPVAVEHRRIEHGGEQSRAMLSGLMLRGSMRSQ